MTGKQTQQNDKQMQGDAEDIPSLSELPLRGLVLCPEAKSKQHTRTTRGCKAMLLVPSHNNLCRLLQCAGGSPDIEGSHCHSAPCQHHSLPMLLKSEITCTSGDVIPFPGYLRSVHRPCTGSSIIIEARMQSRSQDIGLLHMLSYRRNSHQS